MNSGRREPRGSTHAPPRTDHACRAQLVVHHEGFARMRESDLVSVEKLPLCGQLSLPPPGGPPTRTVWLVLTTNALTVYDAAARRQRLAVYALRKLCSVTPLVVAPHDDVLGGPNSTVAPVSLANATAYGVIARFHHRLPESQRPPPLPLPVDDGGTAAFGGVGFFFGSADKREGWMRLLRLAASPHTAANAPLTAGANVIGGAALTPPLAPSFELGSSCGIALAACGAPMPSPARSATTIPYPTAAPTRMVRADPYDAHPDFHLAARVIDGLVAPPGGAVSCLDGFPSPNPSERISERISESFKACGGVTLAPSALAVSLESPLLATLPGPMGVAAAVGAGMATPTAASVLHPVRLGASPYQTLGHPPPGHMASARIGCGPRSLSAELLPSVPPLAPNVVRTIVPAPGPYISPLAVPYMSAALVGTEEDDDEEANPLVAATAAVAIEAAAAVVPDIID